MITEAISRELRLETAHNVRHIGGYRTGADGTTAATAVRAASLHRLTPAGLETLVREGISTVVDLRSSLERQKAVTPALEPWGIEALHAPVVEHDGSPTGSTAPFRGYAAVYRNFLDAGGPAYRKLVEAIAGARGRVLFHCAAGKDRTGVGAALLLGLAGVAEEAIIADYTQSAALLAPLRDEWLPKMAERGISRERGLAIMDSPAPAMAAALAYLRERWGSAEGYLAGTGASPAAIAGARSKMLA